MILCEQEPSITEPIYPDALLRQWLRSVGPRETASERMAADQQAIAREMGRVFA